MGINGKLYQKMQENRKKKKKEKKQAGGTQAGAGTQKSAESVSSPKNESGKKKEIQKPVSVEKAENVKMKNGKNQDTALRDAETAYTRQAGISRDVDAIVHAFQKEITEKKEESSQKLKEAEKYITDFYHLYEFMDFENPVILHLNAAQNDGRKPDILTRLASMRKEWHGEVSRKRKTRRKQAAGRPVIRKKGTQAFHAARKS